MSCSGDKETQKKKYYQKPPKQNKTAPKTNNNKILQKPGENKKIKKEETAQIELYFNEVFVSKLHIH